MKIDVYDEHIVIFGQSGTGKSTLLQYIVKQIGKIKPVWIWDYSLQHQVFPIVENLNQLSLSNLVYRPQEGSEEEFNQFCEIAFNQSNITVAIEEIQEYANKFRFPTPLSKIVRVGRGRGVTYIAVSQRPAEVHNAIISNSHHRFVFRLDLPPDIQYLKRWLKCDEETIKNLPNYYFYYYSPKYQISKVFEPIPI
jgi:DNA helicase HerA-like ATPase